MRKLVIGSAIVCVSLTACASGEEAGEGVGSTTTTTANEPSRIETVFAEYATASSAGNVDAIMKLYGSNPVVKRHPFAPNDYMDRTTELREAEESIPSIKGSGSGFEFIEIELGDPTSVAAPDVTFAWTFRYGPDGSESGGVEGCMGGRDAKAFFEFGKIAEINWGFDDPSKCV